MTDQNDIKEQNQQRSTNGNNGVVSDKSSNDSANTSSSDVSNSDSSKDQKIKALELRVQELENNWKRALADYRNLQKRTEEEKKEFVEFANVLLLQKLLPILDNLEILANHVNDAGLELTLKSFKQILWDFGIVEIPAQNSQYDAATMEAIETVAGEENKVMSVEQKGYTFRGKLLRPARVRVGKGK